MPLLESEAPESHEENGMGGGVAGLVILSFELSVVSSIPMVSSGNSQAGMKVDTSGLRGWNFGAGVLHGKGGVHKGCMGPHPASIQALALGPP